MNPSQGQYFAGSSAVFAPSRYIRKVHWSTSQKCSMACGYCYLYRKPACASLSTDEAKRLITDIARIGAEWFVFGGGDPLVRSDLQELVDFAKSSNLKVDLQTNAVGLDKHDAVRLFSSLDQLGLSLDSGDHKVHDKVRGRIGNFQETINALELAAAIERPVVLRTTLTKQNIGHVDQLAALIKNYPVINKWSIREFAPLGRGRQNAGIYELPPGIFDAEKKRIIASCKLCGLKSSILNFISKDEMDSCYFMVSSDGDVYSHPSVGDYQSIGNIRNDLFSALVEQLEYDQEKRAKRDCSSCDFLNTLTA